MTIPLFQFRPFSALLALAMLCGCASEEAPGAAAGAGAIAAESIERLYEAHETGVMVDGAGTVSRVLPDDREGSRHQRFIVRLDSGHTVLVSHNIDLARRVDGLARGDAVAFRGQYEWNDRGGVVHWTHRDPRGRRPGGWVKHEGRTYR
jgi:hypothetical protein